MDDPHWLVWLPRADIRRRGASSNSVLLATKEKSAKEKSVSTPELYKKAQEILENEPSKVIFDFQSRREHGVGL